MDFDKAKLREDLARLAERGVYLGTSSWKYEGWRGLLYDDSRYAYRGKFAKSRFEDFCLAEYAEVFKTVCVDATFYSYPTVKSLSAMRQQVPDDFLFGFKVTDSITVKKYSKHARYRQLAGQPNPYYLSVEEFGARFLQPLDILRGNVGILIFEFATFFPGDYPDLAAFLADLDPFLARLPKGFPYGIELRNRHWMTAEYFACLAKHGVAHVFNSWTGTPPVLEQMRIPESRPNPTLVGARFLVTPGTKYEESVNAFEPYDRIQVVDSAARAAAAGLITEGQRAYGRRTILFTNNRLEGNAVLTIRAMIDAAT